MFGRGGDKSALWEIRKLNVPHRGLSNYSKNVCHDISSPVLFSSVKLLTVKPTESKEINPKRPYRK